MTMRKYETDRKAFWSKKSFFNQRFEQTMVLWMNKFCGKHALDNETED